jgi:hypothetical protein
MYCSRFCLLTLLSEEIPVIEEQQQEKNNKEQNRAIIIKTLSASICHYGGPPFNR